jgi:phage FluMu gp28-like protein
VTAPLDYLLAYQRAWLQDPASRMCVLKGRQVGFSDVLIGLGSVLEALEYPHDQYVLSYSERQAKELLRDADKWCQVLCTLGVKFRYTTKKTVIEFGNGSRILAIAATKEAVRGARGTIRWDEVAWAREADEVWTALSPILGSNPRYRAILGSTPLAQQGLFYNLTQNRKWSQHRVSLLDAVADGLPRDANELLDESLNPRREYLLEFDAGGKYFGMTELLHALSDEAPTWPATSAPPGRVLGVDLAKINDLSAWVEIVDTPRKHVVETRTLRGTNYRTQRELLVTHVRSRTEGARITKVVIDSTKHPDFVDEVSADLREVKDCQVVGRHGTHKLKTRAYPGLRKAFETAAITCDFDHAYTWTGTAWQPDKRRPLLQALLQVEQRLTPSGLVTYDAPTGADGHADAASALVLAHDALEHAQDGLVGTRSPAHGRAATSRRRQSELIF